MGRRRSGDRILGPYRERDGRFRMCVVRKGVSEWCNLPPGIVDLAAAEAFVDEAREGLPKVKTGLNTDKAVQEYLDHKAKTVCAGSLAADRAATLPFRLRFGDVPVQDLRPRHVEGYLRVLAEMDLRLATQRSYFMALGRMAEWFEALGLTTRNIVTETMARRRARCDALPWAGKTARKKMGRGKPQLRNLAEYLAYIDAALTETDPERRAGALLPALAGIAAGELQHLQPGDLDFAGGIIHIRDEETEDEDEEDGWSPKTASRRRTVELPEVLASDLEALTASLAPDAFVFQQRTGKHAGEPRSQTWLRKLVKAVCAKAGVDLPDGARRPVRVVCPHGLRGTFTSVRTFLAERAASMLGSASHAEVLATVAKDLGHNDHGKTARRNYNGAPEHVQAISVPALRLIVGGAGKGVSGGADPGSDTVVQSLRSRNRVGGESPETTRNAAE